MDLKTFLKSQIDTNDTTVFSSGWVKESHTTKAVGSSEIVVTTKLFNAGAEGLPAELAGWMKDGKITVKQ